MDFPVKSEQDFKSFFSLTFMLSKNGTTQTINSYIYYIDQGDQSERLTST